MFTLHPLAPRLRRRPSDGSARVLTEAALILACMVLALRGEAPVFERAVTTLDPEAIGYLVAGLGRGSLRLAALLFVAGLGDYLVRRASLLSQLRMTRAEIAREQREDEGDPRLRQEQRRRAYQP